MRSLSSIKSAPRSLRPIHTHTERDHTDYYQYAFKAMHNQMSILNICQIHFIVHRYALLDYE